MLCFSGFELYSRWVPLLNFSRRLDFPYICLQFFPGNFSRREQTCIFTDKCIEHFKKWFQLMQLQATLSIFFSRIVRSEALVYNSYFFQNSGFTKIIRHQILCNFSGGCLLVLVKMASKTVTRTIGLYTLGGLSLIRPVRHSFYGLVARAVQG